MGVPLADRPAYFEALLPRLFELRARTGRPHWIVLDEVHHLAPATQTTATLPQSMQAAVLVTVHPDQVAPSALKLVRTVLTVGAKPIETNSARLFSRLLLERRLMVE